MYEINYEVRYRSIYIKICEYVTSVGKIETYRKFVIPIIKKVIKNYSIFRKEIINEQERKVCDEYIRSMRKILIIIEEKIRCYENFQEIEMH